MSRPDGVVVAHLITELEVGGAQQALYRFLAGSDREAFRPVVACLYHGQGSVAGRIRQLGVPVTDLRMRPKVRLDALWRLWAWLRREQPAILHAWMIHAGILARLIGPWAGVPFVINSRRNENIGGRWREWANRALAGRAAASIAVAERVRQVEIERAGLPPGRVVTIYNGIEPEAYAGIPEAERVKLRQSFSLPAKAPLVLYLGRLHRQKGLPTLLQAMAMLHRELPQARLLLAGEGEEEEALRAQSARLGLEQVVIFAGKREDVPALLAACDLLVLPSLWEGLPNAVLEAMAAARPVVATAVGGTPELVRHAETGFLVPPGDATLLARSLGTLLRHPEMGRQMGLAGRGRVAEHFSQARVVAQTEALYRDLLAGRPLEGGR